MHGEATSPHRRAVRTRRPMSLFIPQAPWTDLVTPHMLPFTKGANGSQRSPFVPLKLFLVVTVAIFLVFSIGVSIFVLNLVTQKHRVLLNRALLIKLPRLLGSLELFSCIGALVQRSLQWQEGRFLGSKRMVSSIETSERKLMENKSTSMTKVHRSCRQPSRREENEVATLLPIERWPSTKNRPLDSYSMLVHLHIEKLHLLENQCTTWQDHIVAVIYLPLVHNSSGGAPLIPLHRSTSVDDVIQSLDSLHTFLESTAACALHVELVGQFVPLGNMPGYYPANALKNRALYLAPTEFLVLLDANFVVTPSVVGSPAQSSEAGLPSKEEIQVRLLNKNEVIVVPGYQLANTGQDLTIARIVARDLVTVKLRPRVSEFPSPLASGLLAPFDQAPNLDNSSTLLPLLLTEAPYWPCVLVSASNAPWFDERFVDHPGNSDTSWLSHLAATKLSFSKHPSAFAVHVPQKQPPPRSRYFLKQSEALTDRMKFLERLLIWEIRMGTYIPIRKNCGKGDNPESDKMEFLKTWDAVNQGGVELDTEGSGNGDDFEEYHEELKGHNQTVEEKTVQNQTMVENTSEIKVDFDIGTEDLEVKDEETEEENATGEEYAEEPTHRSASDLVWGNTSAANSTLQVNSSEVN